MARLSLSIRAQRLAESMRGKSWSDPSRLTKAQNTQIRLLAKQMGVTEERLRSYKPSTRSKYMSAAKKGLTAQQMRERDRTLRRLRKKTPVSPKRRADLNRDWSVITRLRDKLFEEGIRVTDDDGIAKRDRLDFFDLYSDESLRAHLRTYGFDYVRTHMEGQLQAIKQYNQSGGRERIIGRRRLQAAFGTVAVRQLRASQTHDEDERWFWYHARLHYGDVKIKV